MKRIKSTICIILVLLMALSLLACNKENTSSGDNNSQNSGNQDSTSQNPGSSPSGSNIPKSIIIGNSGYLGRFLPGVSPAENYSACDAVFDTIFYVDIATKKDYSDILEDYFFEDDLTFIMKLKPGIMFSNGDEATAEDLLFSFLSHNERGSIKYGKMGPIIGDECLVRDKYTVALKFSAPFISFPASVGAIYLIDKSWSQSVGWDSDEWYHPVGSGPYYCAEYVADDHITLKLKDDYWNKEHDDYVVDEWIIKYYPDTATCFMELELGNIAICNVASPDYNRYVRDGSSDLTCSLLDMGVISWFGMGQLDNPIWKDKAVREAMVYGVNWDEVGKINAENTFIKQNSIVSNKSRFYSDPGNYEFNPEKAKQILADAGYAPGDVKVHLYTFENSAARVEAVQFYCGEIGIDISIDLGDTASVLASFPVVGGSDGGFMASVNPSISFDPKETMGSMMNKNITWCYIDDDYFQEIAMNAIYCADPNLQAERFKEVQKYVHDNVLAIPISSSVGVYGFRNEVFNSNQMIANVFTGTYYYLSNLGRASAWN